MPLRVDPEFQSAIPPLSAAERAGPEADLLRIRTCLDPLIVWAGHGIILDGHNRFEICTRHKIPFKITEIGLPDRAAVLTWIRRHQRDRRNLPPDGLSYLRGSMYLAARLAAHRPTNGNGAEKGCHDVTLKTARRVALDCGVNARTIYRDARYTEALDVLIGNCGDDVRGLALSWSAPLTRKHIFKLALLEAEEQRTAIDLVRKLGRAALLEIDDDAESAPKTARVPLAADALARTLFHHLGETGLGKQRKTKVSGPFFEGTCAPLSALPGRPQGRSVNEKRVLTPLFSPGAGKDGAGKGEKEREGAKKGTS